MRAGFDIFLVYPYIFQFFRNFLPNDRENPRGGFPVSSPFLPLRFSTHTHNFEKKKKKRGSIVLSQISISRSYGISSFESSRARRLTLGCVKFLFARGKKEREKKRRKIAKCFVRIKHHRVYIYVFIPRTLHAFVDGFQLRLSRKERISQAIKPGETREAARYPGES